MQLVECYSDSYTCVPFEIILKDGMCIKYIEESAPCFIVANQIFAFKVFVYGL